MKSQPLQEKISRVNEVADAVLAKDLLNEMNLGFLSRAGFYDTFKQVFGDAIYKIPVLQITDFEDLLADQEHGAETVNSKSSKRRFIFSLRKGIIKSAKKGFLYDVLDYNNHQVRGLRRESVAEEIIRTHIFGDRNNGYGLDVVRINVMVESHRREHPLGQGEFYFIERRFKAAPNVAGELKPEHFKGDEEEFEKVRAAYKTFLENTAAKGFRYVPVNEDRPYADLVLKLKKNGRYKVLATDWPHFQKIKK